VNLPSATRRRMRPPLFLWLVALAAFGLRVYNLGAPSLWYDEAFSVAVARADLATAVRLLSADFHPPLYYLVLRAGIALLGSSEFAARFVSLVPGVLLIPLMWALARRLFDCLTGWLAAALACLAPLFVWYSGEARMYSQATAFGLAATYAFVRAQDEGRARWWAAFAVCALGAIYSHYSALYLIAALGLFWLSSFKFQISNFKSRIRLDLWAFGAVAMGVAVSVPHLLGFAQAAHGYWPGRLDVAQAFVQAARVMMGGTAAMPLLSDALAVLCGIVALAAILGALASHSDRRGVWLALVLPLAGTALAFIVLYQQPKFEPRHLMTLAPALWLLVGAGIRALWRMRGLAKAVAILAAIALAGGLAALDVGILAGDSPRDDWRGAVAYLRQNVRPDEAIVLVSGHAFPALAYYDAPPWVALPDDPVLDVTHVLDYTSVAPTLNRIQSERRGVWLALWQEDILDPTQVVPALLSDIGTELPVTAQFVGLRLRHFTLDHAAPFPLDPPMARRLNQSPLPGLIALGVTLSPQPLPADAPLSVRMFWRADVSTRGVAGGSLRVVDAQGQEWARRDELLSGLFLSERWPPGRVVMGQYAITLPVGAPPGNYALRQIVYRGDQTGELELGEVVVTRPLRAPDAAALGISPAGLARLGDLTLLGVALDQQTLKPCETLYFTAVWRSERPPSDDYTLRVTLAGQGGPQPLAPGLPTSQWRPGDVWRTRHHITASCRASDGPAELQLTLVDSTGRPVAAPVSAGMMSINAGRVFAPPAMQRPFRADLGGQVELLGYDIQQIGTSQPIMVELTLYWQATREMTTSLTVFTHVESERVWGQHDGPPALGFKPTDSWMAGEVVADRHSFALDPATPPGKYQLVVGMYDPASQTRLAAFDENGRRWPDDAILLQEIVVAR
jgi:hypothetical protein